MTSPNAYDPQSREESETGRLEAFSDGVLAVIITIMALELKAPAAGSFTGLRTRLPALLIYILSFTFIGMYWNNHHHLLRGARRVTGGVMWANLHLLFWLSLIPVLTAWIGEHYRQTAPADLRARVPGVRGGVPDSDQGDHPRRWHRFAGGGGHRTRRQGPRLAGGLRGRGRAGVCEPFYLIRPVRGGRGDVVRAGPSPRPPVTTSLSGAGPASPWPVSASRGPAAAEPELPGSPQPPRP